MEHKKLTQSEISEWLESIIPADLWAKYVSLSFEEMREEPELEEYQKDIDEAINDWYEADK